MGQVRDERRCNLRIPVRGFAVLHAENGPGPLHGSLENLSQSGALVHVASKPPDANLDLELRLEGGDGWVTARTVRVERVNPNTQRGGWRIAVAFERVEPGIRAAIEMAISHALSAAKRRPILVIDDQASRRTTLIERLLSEGMTPIAPRTPLEAIDLLTRSQLYVSVCMLAPGFGVESTDLATILSDSFPWVTTAQISDDIDDTATRAVAAWAATPVARLGVAIT
jgi:CheY-like chemotaxis protein